MKKFILLILMFSIAWQSFSQQRITLQQCMESAIIKNPLHQQKGLNSESSELKLKDFEKDILPQVYINGKASYQSEVISLPFSIPNMDIPEMSKDQYRVSLDVQQAIYRGGLLNHQKNMESIDRALDELEVDKNLYHLKKDVKSMFFAIILLDEQKVILASYKDLLNAKAAELSALVEEGMILESNLQSIKAEQIQIEIQLNDMNIQRKYLLNNLEILTQLDLSNVVELVVENVNIDGQEHNRLEYDILSSQQQKLEYSKKLIDVQKKPMISAYASGGYGRPGFNYLSDEFDDFYTVGINLKWKILHWKKFDNQKKMIDINIRNIETIKQDFNLNIQMALNMVNADIDKYQNQLNSDPVFIKLRSSIADNSSKQLSEGVITTSRYIEELEKLNQARINQKLHEIQLYSSQLDYLNILGKL